MGVASPTSRDRHDMRSIGAPTDDRESAIVVFVDEAPDRERSELAEPQSGEEPRFVVLVVADHRKVGPSER